MLDNRINNLVHKINVLLLSLIVSFAPSYVFASLMDPTDQWIMESMTENKDSLGRTTTASLNARKVEIVNGSFREVAVKDLPYKPPAGAAGRVMGKRLAQAAVGGGVALIGAALIDGLLKSIGWIMEDGIYVKKKQNEGGLASPADEYTYSIDNYDGFFSSGEAACANYDAIKGNGWWGGTKYVEPNCKGIGSGSNIAGVRKQKNPNYDPDSPPNEQTIPITNQELEDIMYGNYAGDPEANIAPKDDGVWTGVTDTMVADPNAGEGTNDKPANEVTNDIEKKLDAAPSSNKTVTNTGTNSSSSSESTKKNADGTEEKTQTETTQKMPALCQYAAAFCVWMDWTQKDDSDTDQEEIEKEDLDISKLPNTTKVNFGSNCPAPLHGSYSMLGRTFSISYPWDAACDVASKFKPAVVGCAGLAAIYIVLGINRKTED